VPNFNPPKIDTHWRLLLVSTLLQAMRGNFKGSLLEIEVGLVPDYMASEEEESQVYARLFNIPPLLRFCL
jgi:hypothetical protein